MVVCVFASHFLRRVSEMQCTLDKGLEQVEFHPNTTNPQVLRLRTAIVIFLVSQVSIGDDVCLPPGRPYAFLTRGLYSKKETNILCFVYGIGVFC
jgi:hypothetical protein